MGSLGSLIVSLTPLLPRPHLIPPRPHFSSSTLPSSSSSSFSFSFSPSPLRLRSLAGKGASSDESQFLDEDGMVEDMDGYLNYLSLEYESVWDTKPSWCQPWTISLTGVAVIASSWVFLHSPIITAGVSCIICIWWYIFLYAYPKAYSNMIAERRQKVASGVEDTFGINKTQ
ncbi:uncharacterized protein LOC120249824 [Dioscorea cayenensis subsp. rotundata]|uniref:Uncharacterized protein LOC120249824 n=1 Tax=Dioscorea cayennensis subsp. rotundata TaxID=55577 RepID=A0AB40AHN6_DIOCR|nr:uncharacterized protein LOC120249824 [Dioscorea cayenensis subsp. rotundata]